MAGMGRRAGGRWRCSSRGSRGCRGCGSVGCVGWLWGALGVSWGEGMGCGGLAPRGKCRWGEGRGEMACVMDVAFRRLSLATPP